MTNERRFYVYAYFRADGTPYYIGKGQRKRIHERHSVGLPPVDRRKILVGGLSEADAFDYEIALIHCLGRKDIGTGCLRNLTDGGDGASGYVHDDDTKRRISESNKKESYPHLVGRPVSQETRQRIGDAQKGKTLPPEQIEKIRQKRALQVITDEHRQAISEGLRGHKHTEESRAKMSASADPEDKARCARIGWRKSPNRGANISVAKLKPQRWFHPEHGELVCAAKELTTRFGVGNLYALKVGRIKHSKGWTWLGAA